ncbi:hypothetical protein GCM10010840_16450 [Deinococcus aerolatus]|uniref:Uncharacterized protein n=1 Tax=Deinococcus aerolatus TaxID=522487 RepID=A0ABQ2G7M2_9DEIO|nr:hypothetical protein GCM10010840_16450 [Deinococcus aerolatus]
MTASTNRQEAGRPPRMVLTVNDCQEIAERFLDHVGTDPVRNDSLRYLARRLRVLAVEAETRPSRG